MAYPSGDDFGSAVGVLGIYRVVVRAPGKPEDVAGPLTRLLDLPGAPVYENEVAAARGAAVALPSGSELLLAEPFGERGLLAPTFERTGPGDLVLVILEVVDVDRAVVELRRRGATVTDAVATGRGRRMALIDPSATSGLRLAVIELPDDP